ncbi:dipeptidyl aminopeptidase/acylaminoacyl peptidase [Pedobacter sp. CG_S7]|uniref:S9 family peptidase n=1 Tax=Pedobacter sp. CG_S7 TaxID=3143930 RepID=UPI00339B027F
MKRKLTFYFLLFASLSYAQKKPLDHSVYDSWQSIGSKTLTNNGQWAAFIVLPQEGDAKLYFNNLLNNTKKEVPRADQVKFSTTSKYAAFLINPLFKDTRLEKIKKKKADELTKDSLGILNFTTLNLTKVARVKSFKFPEQGNDLIAYLLEKPIDTAKKARTAVEDKKGIEEGTELVYKNLITGIERKFKAVTEYEFSKNGKQLAIACSGSKKDKNAPFGVYLFDTEKGALKTLVSKKGNYKNLVFDEEGEHLAFLGESNAEKEEIKDFNVYYNSLTLDTAQVLVENDFPGMPSKWGVSGDGKLMFNKDGDKLYFGIAPLKKAKDTTLVELENAKLDIWGYKDDYLQPMQLKNAEKEAKKSYLTSIDIFNSDPKIIPLTDLKLPEASLINEGNSAFVLANTDLGNRIAFQWTGSINRDYYLVDVKNGQRKKIITSLDGNAVASPAGKYVLYYDKKIALWSTYTIATGKITVLNKDLNVKFSDEDNDVPADPSSYGLATWTADDKEVFIYDRYDIWSFSPEGKSTPKNITNGYGRLKNITFRYNSLDPEERFLPKKGSIILTALNNNTKENGFFKKNINDSKNPEMVMMGPFKYSVLTKAKDAERYLYDKGNYSQSPNVYATVDLKTELKLSATNPQQQNYNWGTAELVKWTTPKGFKSEGILYKPENFDPNKKYPMIVYFYEKLTDGLFNYQAPAPTPSRLNISYFVSNGYLVFAPDISYEIGYPGKSAMEYINSGVEYLKKNSWVNGAKIGLQGQSWGGYQVAYLITQTNIYAAAWAGAPVANMTSAYGGIRWASGMNRQFQYEKTQSRIGATLWEKPELYIENSPLFYLPNVNTPLAIMANDADGAVPWYQGIELFTGLKRLGKPSWLLNYNNEAHNLVLRQNKKDIQIREQQFFDYYLKDTKAPVWMVGGIPAAEKGRTWGFELTNEKP